MHSLPPSETGTSLVGLLILLLIFAVITGQAVRRWPTSRAATDIHQIVSAFNECQWRAMRERQLISLRCDADNRSLRWLPEGTPSASATDTETPLRRAFTLARDERIRRCQFGNVSESNAATINCFPSGATSAGTIVLEAPHDSCTLIQSRLGAQRVECHERE